MTEKTEAFLAHYGKKGMKWGRRMARSSENLATSALRKKPARALTNAQLKEAIGRMKLEKQYRDLNPKGVSKGYKVALGLLAIGTTANAAIAFRGTVAGQAVENGVKRAFKIIANK